MSDSVQENTDIFVESEKESGVIRQRIYLYSRMAEFRIALPRITRYSPPYKPGDMLRMAENPGKPEPVVVAVYKYGGQANDIIGYYYYDFIGVEVLW